MVEAGDQAPDFVLPGTAGDVRLSEVWSRGKVLLAFYTEDNTPLCSSEVSMLRDDYEIARELGAEVVAVSADSLPSHTDFAERIGGVPFALLCDGALEVAAAYGVVDDAGKRSRRAVFVIGEDGVVLYAEPWFQPGNPSQYEAMFRALGMEA
jgi:peroxiredoxin Q/BCP